MTRIPLTAGFKRLLALFSLIYFSLAILAGSEISHTGHSIFVHFCFVFGGLLTIRQILLIHFARRGLHRPLPRRQAEQPSVAIIVPTYNEQDVIIASLTSLTRLNYDNYEIIMVDDGSQDDTIKLARELADRIDTPKISIISQSNGGKSSALNTGLLHARSDLVLCVDADSRLAPGALLHGVGHFSDSRIGAVAGFVDVANDHKLLARFQKLEYIVSQGFLRKALAWFGAVIVVPGPIGLFRKQAMASIGGYRIDDNVFAEDADLTVRMLAAGWHIISDDRMVAYTEAPETLYPLLRQRYRWKRGIYQVFNDNFVTLIASPDKRGMTIGLFLLFESFLLDVISFGITLFVVTNMIIAAKFSLPVWWTLLFVFLDFLVLLLATGRQMWWRWFPLLMIQKFSYAYILQAWAILSFFDEWRATRMTWDKLERIGNLK